MEVACVGKKKNNNNNVHVVPFHHCITKMKKNHTTASKKAFMSSLKKNRRSHEVSPTMLPNQEATQMANAHVHIHQINFYFIRAHISGSVALKPHMLLLVPSLRAFHEGDPIGKEITCMLLVRFKRKGDMHRFFKEEGGGPLYQFSCLDVT